MERAEALVEILREQIRKGAPRESLIWTLGMIRNEILRMPSGDHAPNGSASMDTSLSPSQVFIGADSSDGVGGYEDKSIQEPSSAIVLELGTIDPRSSMPDEFSLIVPPTALPVQAKMEFGMEINQAVADGKASLNDSLRQGSPELAESLQQQTISDLRKAIGINDRYRFIHELFNGDALAFDETIRVLNEIGDFSVADAYLRRELSELHRWKTDDPMVIQLHQLLKRRFSSM